MMRERNIEDSDSDDSDFKITLDTLSNESSISESDSAESDVEEIPNCSMKQITKLKKIKKNGMKSSLKNTKILSPDYVKHISKDNVEGNPEKEKEKTDLLWNNFLNNTGKQSLMYCENNSHKLTENSQIVRESISKIDSNIEINKQLDTNITKTSKSKQIQAKVYTNNAKSQIFTPQHDLKRKGISNILNTISKKSKLNTLEKSKQDWNQFKEEHNLNEEITNFNRGKNGYLERQDFLQRTDSRQFEIEKRLRNSRKRK